MVTITCQYTGLDFEAASTRSKNHPLVSQFVNDANKDGRHYHGAYHAAKEIISNTGESDIESVLAVANAQYAEWVANAKAAVNRKFAQEKERKEAKKARAEQNGTLRRHGYTWSREDEESMDFAGPNAFNGQTWTLYSSDSREVTVAEALAEIKAAK